MANLYGSKKSNSSNRLAASSGMNSQRKIEKRKASASTLTMEHMPFPRLCILEDIPLLNFARKAIVHSTNLTFHETEFPQRTDFPDEPDEAFVRPPIDDAISSDDDDDDGESGEEEPSQFTRSQPSQSQAPQRSRPAIIYDEIVVEKPPLGTVFSIMFGPLADSTSKSFTDAMNCPDSKHWWDALCAEIKAVIQNKTWDLVDFPPGKRAIPLKWVFRIKCDAKGNFEKYKARIVVKGYSQVAGLDFNETFAPVVRVDSVRVIFAIAAANNLYILHIDCKNAFLHSESDVDIYVYQPERFVDIRFPQKVLHLNKSLYDLKQAPSIWYLFLCGVIVDLGFVALESDT
jgi:Reverse transcriptase (RNA-dependent DNA polymerase)